MFGFNVVQSITGILADGCIRQTLYIQMNSLHLHRRWLIMNRDTAPSDIFDLTDALLSRL